MTEQWPCFAKYILMLEKKVTIKPAQAEIILKPIFFNWLRNIKMDLDSLTKIEFALPFDRLNVKLEFGGDKNVIYH